MSFELPLSELTEINKRNITRLYTRRSKYKICVLIGQRDQIIDLVLLKFKCLNNVFYLKTVQIDKKDFIIECHYNFIQSYFYLFYL
jgi:hypothetical protein